MSTRTILAAAIAACLLGPGRLFAADAGTATTTASAQTVEATVSAVIGLVMVRDAEAAPWRKAQVGMIVPVGGEVRTGPKSSITFSLPHQTLTLDRLGTIKLLEAIVGADTLKTDVGLQYGRVRYSVEAAGIEHESVIRSPSNALAIRGSIVELLEDGLSRSVFVYKGRGQVFTTGGPTVTMGTSDEADYGDQPYVVENGKMDPVQNRQSETVTPYASASSLSKNEQKLVSTNTNVGGMETGVGSWYWGTRGWRGGGTVPPAVVDNGGGNVPPTSNLRFTLNWVGFNDVGAPLPDLDLFVQAPGGALLSPKGVTQSGTGRISGDAGGTIATNGQEIAEFSGVVPRGTYRYGVNYASGEDPATFTIEIRMDGDRVNPDYEDTLTPFDTRVDFSINVAPASAQSKDAKVAKKPVAKTPVSRKPVGRTLAKPTPTPKPPVRPARVRAGKR